jgi:UPF0042 nucleotide-binding protein
MKIVIVTGMSGAGKSTALKVLEDDGYYCVDNMPIALVPSFVELADGQANKLETVALGIDIRTSSFEEITKILDRLSDKNYDFKVLFLDSSDDALVKRFKETRRSHPLARDSRIQDGISVEREKLAPLRERADYIIDSSQLLTRELKQELERIFVREEEFTNLYVTVLSFGFKYGIPNDADLVFDVRFLPNPYYIDELKPQTGNDAPVRDYVMSSEISREFLKKITDLVSFLLPNYVKEGKNSLVIAFGCTGGKHRSVTLANALYDSLKDSDYGCRVEHRDIEKDAKRKK